MIKTKILAVRNPQWANENHTAIDCLVRTNTFQQELPFTASLYDPEAHGREIFSRRILGEFGEIAPLKIAPPPQSLISIKLPAIYSILAKFIDEANRENSRKSFRSVVIIWSSFLDNLLDKLLESDSLCDSSAKRHIEQPPRTFCARIKQALAQGLIDKKEKDKLHHIRKIRNAAAHDWNLSLSTKDVLPNLIALYEADHAQLLVFHNDFEFLIQQVYSTSSAMLAMKLIDRISAY